MTTSILYVIPMKDHKLKINLENGSHIVLNLQRKVKTIRFGILKNPDVWEMAVNGPASITWGGHLSVTLSEILEILSEQ